MKTHRPSPEIIERCREFRHNSTQAETVLWHFLRARQLEGYKFRRQHPINSFILDFYCAELRLAIEVDGGGHLDPDQEEYDGFRTQVLNELGIRVLRFWNNDVLNRPNEVLKEIREVALLRGNYFPHP